MTGGYQPLGQQRREQLPRPVVTRGRPPRDRRQHGDSDRAACLAVNGNAPRLPVPNLAPHRFTQLGTTASLIMLFALHPRLGKGTTTAPLYTRVLTQKVTLEIVVLSCGFGGAKGLEILHPAAQKHALSCADRRDGRRENTRNDGD